jgi:hypothetical protein
MICTGPGAPPDAGSPHDLPALGDNGPVNSRRPTLTSQLYRAARTSNDLRSLARGPVPYSKRVVRRRVYRAVNRNLARSLRGFGL